MGNLQSFSLNAGNASYDPDATASTPPLQYMWDCIDNSDDSDCLEGTQSAVRTSSVLTLTNGLDPGQYAFTVTVSVDAEASGCLPSRSASASAVVTVLLGDPPTVSLAQPSGKVNPSDRYVLRMYGEVAPNVNLKWTLLEGGLIVDSSSPDYSFGTEMDGTVSGFCFDGFVVLCFVITFGKEKSHLPCILHCVRY